MLISKLLLLHLLELDQFNPPGWDRHYDYGTPEHQEAEPYLFPEKEVKFKFWDLVNAIVIFYIGWEAYKYYRNGGRDFLTLWLYFRYWV